MDTTLQNNHKTIAVFLHILSFGKWVIPFGNFILPIVLWGINSKKSKFVDHHGRQVVNFQLSLALYTIVLSLIAVTIVLVALFSGGPELFQQFDGNDFPFSDHMGVFATFIGTGIIIGGALLLLAIVDVIYSIKGAVDANDGSYFKYPLTISFLKNTDTEEDSEITEEEINNA